MKRGTQWLNEEGWRRHINATLRAALSQAQRWQSVNQNVAKLVTLPRGARYLPSILTPEQAKSLLEFLEEHKHEALFNVALTIEPQTRRGPRFCVV